MNCLFLLHGLVVISRLDFSVIQPWRIGRSGFQTDQKKIYVCTFFVYAMYNVSHNWNAIFVCRNPREASRRSVLCNTGVCYLTLLPVLLTDIICKVSLVIWGKQGWNSSNTLITLNYLIENHFSYRCIRYYILRRD